MVVSNEAQFEFVDGSAAFLARRLDDFEAYGHGQASMVAFSIGGVAAVIWLCTLLAGLGWSNPQYSSPLRVPAFVCSMASFIITFLCFMFAMGWAFAGSPEATMVIFCSGGSSMIVTLCTGLSLLAARSEFSDVSEGVTTISLVLFVLSLPVSVIGCVLGVGLAIQDDPKAIMIVWCIVGTLTIVCCVCVLCAVGTYYQNKPDEEENKPLVGKAAGGEVPTSTSAAPPTPAFAPVAVKPVPTATLKAKEVQPEPIKTKIQDPAPEMAADDINLKSAIDAFKAPDAMDIEPGPTKEVVEQEKADKPDALPVSEATEEPTSGKLDVANLDDADDAAGGNDVSKTPDTTKSDEPFLSPPAATEVTTQLQAAEDSQPSNKRTPWWKNSCGPSAGGSFRTPGCAKPVVTACAPNLRPVACAPLPLPLRQAACGGPTPGAITPTKGGCVGALLPQRKQPEAITKLSNVSCTGALFPVRCETQTQKGLNNASSNPEAGGEEKEAVSQPAEKEDTQADQPESAPEANSDSTAVAAPDSKARLQACMAGARVLTKPSVPPCPAKLPPALCSRG